MINKIKKIHESEESQILGLEYEVIESLIKNKQTLDYSIADDICKIYDNNYNNYNKYCEVTDKFNSKIIEVF